MLLSDVHHRIRSTQPEQNVRQLDCSVQPHTSADVEYRTCRRRHRDSSHRHLFAGQQPVVVADDSRRRIVSYADKLRGPLGRDPLITVQRRCRYPRYNSLTPGPQKRSLGAQRSRQFDTPPQMHVVEDLHVVLAQFLSSDIARGQRLARHNEPTHSRTLARRTDKSPKLRFLMYFASSRRITRRVGGEGCGSLRTPACRAAWGRAASSWRP